MNNIIDAVVGAAMKKTTESIPSDIMPHLKKAFILTVVFIAVYFIPFETSIGIIIKAMIMFLAILLVLYFF